MSEERNAQTKKHTVTVDGRKKMNVDGVCEVISFDEWQAVFVTSQGEMTVDGKGLHVSVLDVESGRVELDGEIDGVFYSDGNEPAEKRSLFSRIFG